MVRALASHQCGPGSIPRSGVKCGLSLLVLFSAPRGFSPGTPVSPLLKKPKFDLIVLIVNLIYSVPNQRSKFDLIVLIVNLIYSVPNQRSSARKTRHLNKVPYLTLYPILSNNFCFTRLFFKKKK